ncbi:MAG: MerR family transcriptional regulator, partial [Deltaproteobacteria bacterium]|nr:MerR family transcriptional regulator [Deltaproteobacteria bacterium]
MKIMKRNGTLLRIGDVAGITKVSIHTLRYWENV